jgi:hypothetical protein
MTDSRIPHPTSTTPLLPNERSPHPRKFRAALIANAFTGAQRARAEQPSADVDQEPADEDTGRHHIRPGRAPFQPDNTPVSSDQAPASGAQ